jgi:hypothetical protein
MFILQRTTGLLPPNRLRSRMLAFLALGLGIVIRHWKVNPFRSKSFELAVNGADGVSDIEGKAATVAASELGKERVSIHRSPLHRQIVRLATVLALGHEEVNIAASRRYYGGEFCNQSARPAFHIEWAASLLLVGATFRLLPDAICRIKP